MAIEKKYKKTLFLQKTQLKCTLKKKFLAKSQDVNEVHEVNLFLDPQPGGWIEERSHRSDVVSRDVGGLDRAVKNKPNQLLIALASEERAKFGL